MNRFIFFIIILFLSSCTSEKFIDELPSNSATPDTIPSCTSERFIDELPSNSATPVTIPCCTSEKFIDELPYSFEINKTSEYDLIQKGMIQYDQYSNENEQRMYKHDHELYCYINKQSSKLEAIKIWKPTDDWVNNGIKIGMSQEDLIQVLAMNKIDYYILEDIDDNLYVERNKLKYWFCFPKRDDSRINEMKNQLNFIVVNSLEN